MNAYLVRIPEERVGFTVSAPDAPEPWWPIGVFAAETPAQAKLDALREWASWSRSGVYDDDWTALRVRLLGRDIDAPRGPVLPSPLFDRLWDRVHEVLDHAGAPCDCPDEDA